MILVSGLTLAGAIYESVSEAADSQAYPPPGQLVDVGGHRLHINCTGAGSPTVVIEAGLGDWSTSWAIADAPGPKKRQQSSDSEAGPLPRGQQNAVGNVDGEGRGYRECEHGLRLTLLVHEHPQRRPPAHRILLAFALAGSGGMLGGH